jgi:hypothetical protein
MLPTPHNFVNINVGDSEALLQITAFCFNFRGDGKPNADPANSPFLLA